MQHVKHLACLHCGRQHQALPSTCTCATCAGILEVVYDYNRVGRVVNREYFKAAREHSMWRYLPLLPVELHTQRTPLRVGFTPIYEAVALARLLGLDNLLIKDDGQNPTGSLKDRAAAVGLAKAMEAGENTVACASTGNAASALAGNAAALGKRACIFVPERAPRGKIAQLLVFGATVVSVQGSYLEAIELSRQAIKEYGWYNHNAAINPYLVEGKKTVSLEICEQLDWQVPDWVVFSVGDGCTIAGAWKGFVDAYAIGLIDRLPKMLGVQAAGSCPISKAFHSGEPLQPMAEQTLADSIAVGTPLNPDKALRAVRDSGGTMATVQDEEILQAMSLLGKKAGVFGEPAGVAGLAGLIQSLGQGIITPQEKVLLCVTGNGLKDVYSAGRAVGEPLSVKPNLRDLAAALPKELLG
ncbi:MAG: Threonine synthase [Firmicutes bacterium]|nr:Threonine synthase [Bacillota bacterium]